MKSAAATFGLVMLSVFCLLQWSVVSGCTDGDQLFRDITQNYEKSVAPDNVVLKVAIVFHCAHQDKTSGELITYVWERMSWSDKRLSWKPEDCGGIEEIVLPAQQIWLPDPKLYNAITSVEERDFTNLIVRSDGTVFWTPFVLYRTFCSSDSDGKELNCQFIVGSWAYDTGSLTLELNGAGANLENYQNSTCPLVVKSASAVIQPKHYPCCEAPFDLVVINLQLKPNTASNEKED